MREVRGADHRISGECTEPDYTVSRPTEMREELALFALHPWLEPRIGYRRTFQTI